jgi:hypothetical protein
MPTDARPAVLGYTRAILMMNQTERITPVAIPKRVLWVCLGSICCSPTAGAVLRQPMARAGTCESGWWLAYWRGAASCN